MGMVKRCCGRAQQRKGEFMIRITQFEASGGAHSGTAEEENYKRHLNVRKIHFPMRLSASLWMQDIKMTKNLSIQ